MFQSFGRPGLRCIVLESVPDMKEAINRLVQTTVRMNRI